MNQKEKSNYEKALPLEPHKQHKKTQNVKSTGA